MSISTTYNKLENIFDKLKNIFDKKIKNERDWYEALITAQDLLCIAKKMGYNILSSKHEWIKYAWTCLCVAWWQNGFRGHSRSTAVIAYKNGLAHYSLLKGTGVIFCNKDLNSPPVKYQDLFVDSIPKEDLYKYEKQGMQWDRLVSQVYTMTVPGNQRVLSFDKEIERVKIPKWITTEIHPVKFPICLREDVLKYIGRKTLFKRSANWFDLSLNFYRMLADAEEHEYRRILWLEDDVRFLKDTCLIKYMIDKCPDSDIVFLDYAPSTENYKSTNPYVEEKISANGGNTIDRETCEKRLTAAWNEHKNEPYVDIPHGFSSSGLPNSHSSSCLLLSLKAITCLKKWMDDNDVMIGNDVTASLPFPELSISVPKVNVAIQQISFSTCSAGEGANNPLGYVGTLDKYRRHGIRHSMYSVPDGYDWLHQTDASMENPRVPPYWDKDPFERPENIPVPDSIKNKQKKVLEIYKKVKKILDTTGATWFATGGTAIGSLVYKGFIPWDDDMDLLVTDDKFSTVIGLICKDKSLYVERIDKFFHICPSYDTSIHVDIFPLTKTGDGKLVDCASNAVSRSIILTERQTYPEDWFLSYTEVPFEDTTIRVPNGCNKYLEKRYGIVDIEKAKSIRIPGIFAASNPVEI